MQEVALPLSTPLDHDTPYEYGAPVPNANAIPIDPALGGPIIDPALMAEGEGGTSNDFGGTTTGANLICIKVQPEMQYPPQHVPPSVHYTPIQQYSEGPQGDPFAPQQLPVYFPIEVEHPAPVPKPTKRKRRPAKERECLTCHSSDRKNADGQVEPMVTCSDCGLMCHASCLQISAGPETLLTYPWKCNDCKSCEICQEKGNEACMLFCDFCDRGWHMDCMDPPIKEIPEDPWSCPACPPAPANASPDLKPEIFSPVVPTATIPANRGHSIASSSRSSALPTRSHGRPKGKGKAKVVVADGSDSQDVDIEATPQVNGGLTRQRSARKLKANISRAPQYFDDDVQATPSSPRQAKRTRLQPITTTTPAHPTPKIRLLLPNLRKGKAREREEDEPKGLFDDVLSMADRDTVQTSITQSDEQRFERSRRIAEEKLYPPSAISSEVADISSTAGPSRPTRASLSHQFSAFATPTTPLGFSSMSPAPSTPGPFSGAGGASLRIRTIRFGKYDIQTWYDAPFPEEYANIPDGRLWICEFCLKYMKSRFAIERHWLKCKARHPPGDEIYRDGDVSIFEVDGRKNKIYCQNLCLLSKMFLDHKSLFYDVEPFLFYVMTEVDDFGARFVGYFSKEKRSPKDFNVSCIMTLPVRQRQGWGNLLIDFSYLLSKKERRTGSPEKPLSGLGALGYKNYWTLSSMRYLKTAPDKPRLEDISIATSMTIEDIFVTLTQQGMITARDVTPPPPKPVPGQSIKFIKGRKNGVARKQVSRSQSSNKNNIKNKDADVSKGPFEPPTDYTIAWDREKVDEYLAKWEAKGYLKLRPEKLQWSPYVLTKEDLRKNISIPEAGTSATKPIEISDKEKEMSEPLPPLNIFDDEVPEEKETAEAVNGTKFRSRTPSVAEAETVGTPRKDRTRNWSTVGSKVSTPRRNGRRTKATSPRSEANPEQPVRTLRTRHNLDERLALPSPGTLPKTLVPSKRPRTELHSDGEEEGTASKTWASNGRGKAEVDRAEDVGAMLFNDEVVSLVLAPQEGEEKVVVDVGIGGVKTEDVYDADAEGEEDAEGEPEEEVVI